MVRNTQLITIMWVHLERRKVLLPVKFIRHPGRNALGVLQQVPMTLLMSSQKMVQVGRAAYSSVLGSVGRFQRVVVTTAGLHQLDISEFGGGDGGVGLGATLEGQGDWAEGRISSTRV